MSTRALIFGLVGAFAALTAPASEAGVMLKYSVNGGAFVTVADGQVGSDLNPMSNMITTFLMGTIGPKLVFEQLNGTQTLMPGQLHLSLQGSVAAGAVGTLEVMLTGTDYDAGPNNLLRFGANVSSTSLPSNTTLQYDAWVDDNNVAFGTTTQIASTTLSTEIISPNLGMGGDFIDALLDHAFSLTQRFFFTFASNGMRDTQAQGTISTTDIEEPAMLSLLGLGILGLGLVRRRRIG